MGSPEQTRMAWVVTTLGRLTNHQCHLIPYATKPKKVPKLRADSMEKMTLRVEGDAGSLTDTQCLADSFMFKLQ